MAGELAPALWGIPVVSGSSERAALFPAPATDQRVFNKATGNVERYTGSAWQTDIVGVAGKQPVFYVPSFAAAGVDITTGVNDATSAIQTAQALALATGGVLDFGPGTFKHTTNLVFTDVPVVRGVPGATILQPSAAVSGVAVTLDAVNLSGATMKGFIIDGTNAPTATGFQYGGGALTDWLEAKDLFVKNFSGVGGVGVRVRNSVHSIGRRIYTKNNKIGLLVQATVASLPTATRFEYCAFRESLAQGVKIVSGAGITFYECTYESNAAEGMLVQSAVGDVAAGIRLIGGWFEANNVQDASHYSLVADGTVGTCQVSVQGTKFNGSAGTEKAIHFTAISDYVIDAPIVANRAANILLDGNGTGYIPNWNGRNCGAYATTVSDTNAQAINTEARLAAYELAWAAWTPTVAGVGGGSYTTTSVTCRFFLLGKTLHFAMRIRGTVAGTVNSVNVSLPNGLVPIFTSGYPVGCIVYDGAAGSAPSFLQVAASNTLNFIRASGAAFGTGVSQTGIDVSGMIEVA